MSVQSMFSSSTMSREASYYNIPSFHFPVSKNHSYFASFPLIGELPRVKQAGTVCISTSEVHVALGIQKTIHWRAGWKLHINILIY